MGGEETQACDLAGSCHKLENIMCVCSPEHHLPKHQGTSTQKQWIEGKDLFSFPVLVGWGEGRSLIVKAHTDSQRYWFYKYLCLFKKKNINTKVLAIYLF